MTEEVQMQMQRNFLQAVAQYRGTSAVEFWGYGQRALIDHVPSDKRRWFYTSPAWGRFIEKHDILKDRTKGVRHRPPISLHTQRWPTAMHEKVKRTAQLAGCSLNEYVMRTVAAVVAGEEDIKDDQSCSSKNSTSTTFQGSNAEQTSEEHVGAT